MGVEAGKRRGRGGGIIGGGRKGRVGKGEKKEG